MKNGTPFLIEKEEFENHSVTDSCDGTDKLPFEFWNTMPCVHTLTLNKKELHFI